MNSKIPEIVGQIFSDHKYYEYLDKVAQSNCNVLLVGESGVGKELIANMIVAKSKRCNNPYISVNLGSIPETLLESVLFGHKKGSFTSADKDHVGFFEEANKGTLFLDEIGLFGYLVACSRDVTRSTHSDSQPYNTSCNEEIGVISSQIDVEIWILNTSIEEFNSKMYAHIKSFIVTCKAEGRLDKNRLLSLIQSQFGDILEVFSYEDAIEKYGEELIKAFRTIGIDETCCNVHCSDEACYETCKPCQDVIVGPSAFMDLNQYSRERSTVTTSALINGVNHQVGISVFDGYELTNEIVENIKEILQMEGIEQGDRERLINTEIKKLKNSQ